MSALLAWMMSDTPCAPSQTAIVCGVVFGVLAAELLGIAWLCARAAVREGEE